MIHGTKDVGVDTSMLLVIDPAYLFTDEEWQDQVVPRAEYYDNDYPRAVLEALADRHERAIPKLAAVIETVGDGAFHLSEKGKRVCIQTS